MIYHNIEETCQASIAALPEGCRTNTDHEWQNAYSDPWMGPMLAWRFFPELELEHKAILKKFSNKKERKEAVNKFYDEKVHSKYGKSSFFMPYQICKYCYRRSDYTPDLNPETNN